MSWLGLLIVFIAAWIAIKVVKFVFKLVFWAIALVAAYWFLAPYLGLPELPMLLGL